MFELLFNILCGVWLGVDFKMDIKRDMYLKGIPNYMFKMYYMLTILL